MSKENKAWNWIKEKLEQAEGDTSMVYPLYFQFQKETKSEITQSSYRRTVRKIREEMIKTFALDYTEPDMAKLEAQKQKKQDQLRIANKKLRESNRLYNMLDELYNEYIETLKQVDLPKFKLPNKKISKKKYGIINISDSHANVEIYEKGIDNEYNFTVMSKRIQKMIAESKYLFKHYGVTDVLLINSGDTINSDRRLSEKMSGMTSNVRASLLATYILSQALMDLAKDFNTSYVGVVGNESRIPEKHETTEVLLSQNFDYLIEQQLDIIFSANNLPIKILGDTDLLENDLKTKVFKLGGFTGLVTHGENLSAKDIDKSQKSLISLYNNKGYVINGVFTGHFHNGFIGDLFNRSGATCGQDPYAKQLMFPTRASHNAFIINDDNSFNGMKIDLQNTDGYEGYNIVRELERYNIHEKSPTVRVTIENIV